MQESVWNYFHVKNHVRKSIIWANNFISLFSFIFQNIHLLYPMKSMEKSIASSFFREGLRDFSHIVKGVAWVTCAKKKQKQKIHNGNPVTALPQTQHKDPLSNNYLIFFFFFLLILPKTWWALAVSSIRPSFRSPINNLQESLLLLQHNLIKLLQSTQHWSPLKL